MDNFTDKSSEAIKSSFELAEEHHNSQGEFLHECLGRGHFPRRVIDRAAIAGCPLPKG